jgi:hypothetical protein
MWECDWIATIIGKNDENFLHFSYTEFIAERTRMIASLQALKRMSPVGWNALTALYLLCATAFLYSFLFVQGGIPVAGNGVGDCFTALAPAQRMYQGDGLIYRDLFEFVTPGVALVGLAFFKCFGLRPFIPDLLALFLGVGLAAGSIVIARRLMHPAIALLPSAIFLVGVRRYLYDPNHHWFSLVSALVGIGILMERRTPMRIAVAGLCCGLSACFHQSNGLGFLIGFMAFLCWESWCKRDGWRMFLKRQALLLLCFLVTLLAVCGYFIWAAGPARFFWCTVVFVVK